MNAYQVTRQLAYLLRQATWPGSATAVFHDVKITQAPVDVLLGQLRAPFALIRVGSGSPDDQAPRLMEEGLEVAIVASSAGDGTGQVALVGGPRAGGQTSSSGRGVLELEEELLRAAAKLGGQNGVRLNLVASGRGEALLDGTTLAASRGYSFRARTSTERSYRAPSLFVATAGAPGSGNVSMTWDLPPARFDRLEVVLRRASGATAPTSPTDGTGVALSGPLATSVTDSPGAGTWSYALFAGYDETSATPTTSDRWSSPVTRTSVVVLP